MTAKATLKILVVDDDPEIRESIIYFFTGDGHEFFEASDGNQAMDLLVKTPEIDLVISDFNMPGMNGANLNLVMQEKNIRRPFILCTGNPEQISHEQFSKLNLYALIAKPYILDALEKCIEAIASAKVELQLLRESRMASDSDDC